MFGINLRVITLSSDGNQSGAETTEVDYPRVFQ